MRALGSTSVSQSNHDGLTQCARSRISYMVGGCLAEAWTLFTHLVVDILCGALEGHVLLEDAARLLQLLALGPVVKSAGDVDLVARVLPRRIGQ